MRAIHVVNSIHRVMGGPPRSVTGLARELAKVGCEVDLCALDIGERFGEMVEVDPKVNLRLAPAWSLFKFGVFLPRGFKRVLREAAEGADVIHSHGLWLPVYQQAAEVAKEMGVPHVISPRGTMSPYALGYRAWKKRIVARLWQDRVLHEASAFFAASAMERDFVWDYGVRRPVAVTPIGIDPGMFEGVDRQEAKAAVADAWSECEGKKIALFLARLHPGKGLAMLAEAWGRLYKQHPDWRLVIAGPNERGYLSTLKELLAASGAAEATTITGTVSGLIRRQLYAACDLFVLPSHSENFGIVVAEALAASRPVITTVGAPWRELLEHRAGWWIDIDGAALTEAMREAMEAPETTLDAMGQRGRTLVEENYFWPAIAQKTVDAYHWLADPGGRTRPDCVYIT